MRRLAILGAGGHGRVIADAALLSGQWDDVVFYDDAFPRISCTGVFPVVGNSADLIRAGLPAIVAIGDNKIRLNKSIWLQQQQITLAVICHPAAVIAKDCQIGAGTVVFAGAIINPGTVLGLSCIINSRAVVEHDCTLSDGVHISPGASLGGACKVQVGVWVGIGAAVRHGIQIGEFAVVGTGAAVVRDVNAFDVVVGVPARPLKKNG